MRSFHPLLCLSVPPELCLFGLMQLCTGVVVSVVVLRSSPGLLQGLGTQMLWLDIGVAHRQEEPCSSRGSSFYSVSWVWIICFQAVPAGQVAKCQRRVG